MSIPGCKHGPAYEIPQPCADCERERVAERARLAKVQRQIGEIVAHDFQTVESMVNEAGRGRGRGHGRRGLGRGRNEE